MKQTYTYLQKIIQFLKLFTPMAITQFSLLAGSFVALFLSGQYSTADLAGVSIGYNIWISIYTGCMGILLGITPIISHLLGANKLESMRTIIQHGLYVATAMGIFLLLVCGLCMDNFLTFLHMEYDAYVVALKYLGGIAFAILPLLWVCVLRNTVDSHGYTHYSMYVTVFTCIINIIFNYIFIAGRFGLPALGGMGAGFATALSVWLNFLIYCAILTYNKAFRHYKIFTHWVSPQWTYIREQLKMGIPIGISIFMEVSIFSIAGLLMVHFGTNYVAAHQAALGFTNLFYCFPLSISMASTIAVAFELGANRPKDALHYSYVARGLAIVIAIAICSYTFTHMESIAHMFTNDSTVATLIISFLSYAVFFAVIDAFGTPLQGILRGYKDVKIISYIAIFSYYGVGLPIAYFLSRTPSFGPYGIWVGLLSSVIMAGVLFTFRTYYIQHKIFPLSHKNRIQ